MTGNDLMSVYGKGHMVFKGKDGLLYRITNVDKGMVEYDWAARKSYAKFRLMKVGNFAKRMRSMTSEEFPG